MSASQAAQLATLPITASAVRWSIVKDAIKTMFVAFVKLATTCQATTKAVSVLRGTKLASLQTLVCHAISATATIAWRVESASTAQMGSSFNKTSALPPIIQTPPKTAFNATYLFVATAPPPITVLSAKGAVSLSTTHAHAPKTTLSVFSQTLASAAMSHFVHSASLRIIATVARIDFLQATDPVLV